MNTTKRAGLLLLLCMLSKAVSADNIVLSADNWCPFNCIPKTDKPGYMIEAARVIFAKKGHTVEYKVLPWSRAVKSTRVGIFTGIIGPYVEDAPDFVFPKNELAMVGFTIFVQKSSNWNYTGLSSLSHISLGVINDYAYTTEIDNYIIQYMHEPNRVQVVSGLNPLERNIKKLLNNRIDALIATEPVYWYAVNEMGVKDKVRAAGLAVAPSAAYIAFSPAIEKSKEYAQILSDGIASLRKSGELEKILNRYGLDDWKR